MLSRNFYKNAAENKEIEEIYLKNFKEIVEEIKFSEIYSISKILSEDGDKLGRNNRKTVDSSSENINKIFYPSKNDLDNLENILEMLTEGKNEVKSELEEKYSIAGKFIENYKCK